MFDEYQPGGSFWLAGAGQLVVPRLESTQGEMAFGHYCVHCWNQFPMEIRSAPTASGFRNKLKAALFSHSL